jgi:hypothetical protein
MLPNRVCCGPSVRRSGRISVSAVTISHFRRCWPLIAQNFTGLVCDAHDSDHHEELRRAARERHLETVLDPKAFELSTMRGPLNQKLAALAWAGTQLPHDSRRLRGAGAEWMTALIADEVAGRNYSAVLNPTHLLSSVDDEWLSVDIELARNLRRALDQHGLQQVTIYFPLTLRSKVFHNSAARERVMRALADAPIDAVWLRIHPFSSSQAGPLVLRSYIEAARDLHRLGLPIVGERTGTAGVALMAFGAIGGIESGVTHGERFDVNNLFKPPRPGDKPFAPSPRVYLSAIGGFVSRAQAAALMSRPRMQATFGCRDTDCCTRGHADTDRDPRRHFLLQRQREIKELGLRPEPVRAGIYLEDFLRPASDLALRAAKVDPIFESARQRLEHWRLALGALHKSGPPPSFAKTPDGQRTHPSLLRSA